MYQGKNPTAHSSQKLLLDAMNKLLTEKEFKDISISELCCRSGVSRQTFYSLFAKKENVILYQLNLINNTKVDDEDDSTIKLADMCERFGTYVASNYAQLSMLIENELTEVLYTLMCQSLSSCRQSFVSRDDELCEYAAQFVSSGLCRLTQKYIQEHKKADQNELARLAYKIMSGSIFQI